MGRLLQGAKVLGNCFRLRRVGDQPDVSVRADEDQGVGAVCAGRVSAVVEETAGPDKVGLDHVRFYVAEYRIGEYRIGEHRGAAFTQTEQGEMRPAEEIEKADGRAGGGVDQRRVRCPDVAASISGASGARSPGRGLVDRFAV